MLRAEIQEIFKEHKGRYGSLRITKVLEKSLKNFVVGGSFKKYNLPVYLF
ncbi:IS3 family transposase [Priestia sp. D3YE.R1]